MVCQHCGEEFQLADGVARVECWDCVTIGPHRNELDKLAPYLDPDAVIPGCPVLGKPAAIDLSDMEI